MAVERVLAVAGPMLASIEAFAALGASLRLRREDGVVLPELAVALDAVLDALGVREVVNAVGEDETASVLGLVEGFLTQAVDLVANPGRAGWDHEDARILVAQGNTSSLLAGVFRRSVVPSLGGDLAPRLETHGASFLDVGAGVGALSIAMCRLWPALHVVGIDPWEPALELARTHVATAGLEHRIELHQAAAQDLQGTEEHDLAWIPTIFISGTVLELALLRVHAALRAGGCAILGLYARPDDRLGAALADLRTVRHGGTPVTPRELAALMTRVGFVDVEILFDTAWRLPMVFVVGRR